MSQAKSYVSFHDLTPKGTFLWASPSVVDILGYTSEELLGTSPYDHILEEDYHLAQSVHKECIMGDMVAGQVTYRARTKDGRIVLLNLILNMCYDIGIACGTLLDSSGEYVQFGLQSSAMARKMGSKKEEFERLRRHHRAFQANSHLWDVQGFVPEPRVVMILNRFTRNLIVMYASQACGTIFNIEPEQIEGKPILLFVRSDELGIFVENVDTTRSSGSIMNIRFWFQSPNLAHEIPCEAVIFGCSDGIVAIMRQCKPFVRRYLIGGTEHSRSMAGNWPRRWYVSPSPSGSMMSTSPSSSISSTPPKLTMSRLKNIRVVDRHDRNIRPLEEVAKVDPYLAKDIDLVTEKLGIREFSIQDNVHEVSDSEEEDDDIDISERYEEDVDVESAESWDSLHYYGDNAYRGHSSSC